MSNTRGARLTKWQIWLLSLSGVLLWLSGSAWLLLHYFGRTQGDFGPETNPLEPWMLRLHGLVMLPALLGVGGLFIAHFPKGWLHKPQRIGGIVLSVVLLELTVTGYLLYYTGDDDLRTLIGQAHWIAGLGVPVAFIWHYLNGLRARRRASRRKSPAAP
jgi:hypothetical protein